MGRRCGDQASLFHHFRLDKRVSKDHLLSRIDRFVTAALADMHGRLKPYHSEIGRPDHRVLDVDEIVEPIAELHSLVGFGLPGFPVGQAARLLHLPQQQGAAHQRHRV
jgi:hypothetical protein